MLVGKYIPNLVAKTFDEYVQLIYDQTSSPHLDKVFKKWDQGNWASPEQRQGLAYIILVELLAHQFAPPVRWIETQDHLFKDFAFERFIEIGPSPTLTGMATRTLKAKYDAQDDFILIHASFSVMRRTARRFITNLRMKWWLLLPNLPPTVPPQYLLCKRNPSLPLLPPLVHPVLP